MKPSRRDIVRGWGIALCLLGSVHAFAADPRGDAPKAEAWCTKVSHAPQQPKAEQPVTITAAVQEGLADVVLQYQVVEPGAYVELKDTAYATDWRPLPMKAGETAKGRTTYTAQVPADVQKHRRLVRYRVTAKGAAGKPLLAPMTEAKPPEGGSPAVPESPSNYAYFVYNGLPPWSGAINPRSNKPALSRPTVFPPESLARVQAYHFVGKKNSIENTTWREQSGGKEYRYTGTIVADGVVYDHVRYRARGGVWRFAMGKNMWKFDFPSDSRLKARDDYGRPYPVSWSKLNLRSIIQLGSYGRRGEQGMYEAVGMRLFNLAGVPAPHTHWIQLRIINDAEESPADQYQGDFWGLYLAIENEDGRFLKTHGMPDGNLYKMMGGTGELENQGQGQPADRSDLDQFMREYQRGDQTEDWWRRNLNLPSYYSYRSILECIHHYDVDEGAGKNYDYYRNPKTGKWQVIPWDLDLTWADHMYGNGEEPFKQRVARRQPFRVEYFNRMREIRDLLYNSEQTGRLIDECAAVISDPTGKTPSIVEADRRKWDYHPALGAGGQGGHGQFYRAASTQDFGGMVQLMKDYVKARGAWIDSSLADPKIPATPTIAYAGPTGYPADKLRFRASAFKGQGQFAAVKWRLAEVAPPAVEKTPPTPGKYEIVATWESEELKSPDEVAVPANVIKPGHTYRARVRMKDTTGRWSHWSAPIEFVARATSP
jgi:spore coat protein CotH